MKDTRLHQGPDISGTRVAAPVAIKPLAAAVFLGGIGGGIAFPILPLLGIRLGLSSFLIGMILSANRITRLGMNPITGHWIDRAGGKFPLTIGLLIEALTTAEFSLSLHTTIPGILLLLGRAAWGVGSSLLIVGGMTLALNMSDERNRGRNTAAVRMAMSLGMPAGLLLGGVVAGMVSNEAAFYTAAAIALIAAAISWLFIADDRENRKSSRADNETAPGRKERFLSELRLIIGADPRVKSVWVVNLLVFFSIQGVLLATLVLVVHDRNLAPRGVGVQPTAGALMAVMILSSAPVTLWVGRLLDRTGRRAIIALPAVFVASSGFVLLALSHGFLPAAIGLVLVGAGSAGVSIPLLTLLGELTPPDRRGRTVGIYQLFGDIGGSLGPILGVEAVRDLGYNAVYFSVSALLLLICVLLFRLRQSRHAAVQPTTNR